jgi:hypothetical protein
LTSTFVVPCEWTPPSAAASMSNLADTAASRTTEPQRPLDVVTTGSAASMAAATSGGVQKRARRRGATRRVWGAAEAFGQPRFIRSHRGGQASGAVPSWCRAPLTYR